jgi:hypothetical protein
MRLQNLTAGFGYASQDQIGYFRQHLARQEEMMKALSAGFNTPDLAQIDQPLVPQSIEGTLANAELDLKQIKFWKALFKRDVQSTIHEFRRIDSTGTEDIDGFFPEGKSPLPQNTVYSPDFTRVRCLGVKGSVSLMMQQSRILGPNTNSMAEEVDRKTHLLLKLIERALFFANSDTHPLAFDGLKKQLEDAYDADTMPIIRDMRNDILTGAQIKRDLTLQVEDLYAEPEVIQMPYSVASTLGELGEPSIRRIAGDDAAAIRRGRLGMVAAGIEAEHGYVHFERNLFLKPRGRLNQQALQPDPDKTAPSAPVVSVQPASGALGGGEESKWFQADVGAYIYEAVAVGPNGVSAPVVFNAVNAVAGQKITMTLNDNGVSNNDVWYYRVARSLKNGDSTTAKWFMDVRKNQGGNTVITDFNENIPGTCCVFSLMMSKDIIQVIRLLDMMKLDLAVIETTLPFLLIIFMALQVLVPSKLFMWKNVKPSQG